MVEPFPFDQIALKHIKVFVEEIGPRPAGSKQERGAFGYVAGILDKMGYQVNSCPAPFAPLPIFSIAWVLSGSLIILAGYFFDKYPWATLWMPLVPPILLQLEKILLNLRPKNGTSQYLYATSGGEEDFPLLVICAHCDSAKATAISAKTLRWLSSHTLNLTQRISFLISFVSLITLIGFGVPSWLNLLIKFTSGLGGAWFIGSEMFNQFAQMRKYSPGAIDNASGVGVLLSLAEYYQQRSPSRLRLGFLFTGAEETGLHGSESFVKTLSLSSPTAVINLDMVGAGRQLYFVQKEGIVFFRRTDAELNHLLQTVYPAIKPMINSVRSGDHASFIKFGIPSVSLQTGGSKEAELSYHSRFDTLDLIDPASLSLTCLTVVKVIENLPDSPWATGQKYSK
jgi:hypothetical protein